MPRLLVFNPEHDYSLAANTKHYYPPAGIIRLRKRFQFLPLLWARDDDFILLDDNSIVSASTLRNCEPADVQTGISEVEPWGWDLALKARLGKIGLSLNSIPSDEDIAEMRRLSHRRISILCNRHLQSEFMPKEFFSVEEALEFRKQQGDCCFKAPWSSSGRGLCFTFGLNSSPVGEWLHGVIKKQGSVIGETIADKKLDFASLWVTTAGGTEFRGFSITEADGRGRYRFNYVGSPAVMQESIADAATEDLAEVVGGLKNFIEINIQPFYKGRLGVDMLIQKDGRIRPCIEINLRNTMGHVAMDIFEKAETEEGFSKLNYPSNLLSFFRWKK